ncbi:MAG TPA: ATP-binding protein, partial [Leptospiraceae bacterium]|nr:ATP-binding protein [Leptospiraceae bacterium]
KKDNSGTGLGLSVCHSIIKEHKGSISVMSYNKKTKFKIKLPMEMHP